MLTRPQRAVNLVMSKISIHLCRSRSEKLNRMPQRQKTQLHLSTVEYPTDVFSKSSISQDHLIPVFFFVFSIISFPMLIKFQRFYSHFILFESMLLFTFYLIQILVFLFSFLFKFQNSYSHPIKSFKFQYSYSPLSIQISIFFFSFCIMLYYSKTTDHHILLFFIFPFILSF